METEPYFTTLPLNSRPNCETYSSSAFRMAVPSGGEGLDQFVFSARNVSNGVEEFKMHRSYVGDHSGFRLSDLGQRCDLAGVRHAHFDDGDVVLGLELQEHQRQSEVIVEVPSQTCARGTRGKHVRYRFFSGGFSGRTGHGNQRFAPKPTNRRRQCLQGDKGIVHYYQRERR